MITPKYRAELTRHIGCYVPYILIYLRMCPEVYTIYDITLTNAGPYAGFLKGGSK